jgi:hypothetical protein
LEHLSEQFEDLIFPGIEYGYRESRHEVTYRGTVPKLTDPGKRRVWRSSSIENPHGMWADKPLTSYGTSMMYMDVPHEAAEKHRAGESSAKQHYAWYDRSQPLPGKVNKVQFRDPKPYEHSDWNEYKERWG